MLGQHINYNVTNENYYKPRPEIWHTLFPYHSKQEYKLIPWAVNFHTCNNASSLGACETENFLTKGNFDWKIALYMPHNNNIPCELNYHDQKIRRTLTYDIRKHWTAVSTLLGLISSVYRDLYRWRSNQRPQIAEPKLYHWAINPYRTQVTPN